MSSFTVSDRAEDTPAGHSDSSAAAMSHDTGRSGIAASSTAAELVRRLADVTVAGGTLIVFSPLIVAVAILVKWDSSGPALFRQARIGRDRRRQAAGLAAPREERRKRDSGGRPFQFYKFRTMYADARSRFPEMYDYSHSREELAGLSMKSLMGAKETDGQRSPVGVDTCSEDPRIPPICSWLRTTSLDELPNLWNVLTGDMHLVGPRPDLPEHIQYYDSRQRKKLTVKPGVTGLAQVSGRGRLTFEETLQYDLSYIEERSLLLDIKVLLRTVRVFINRDGAF